MEAVQIAHMVFFKLKDRTPNGRQKLVAALQRLIATQTGLAHASVGVIGENYEPPVSDRDFDVALHLVFEDKAAHGKYLPHPEHKKFIQENLTAWEKVRVFDSEVQPMRKK